MKKTAILLIIIASVMCLCACKKDITQRGNSSEVSVEAFKGKEMMHLAKSVDFLSEDYCNEYSYCEGYLYCLAKDDESSYENSIYNIKKYCPETGETTDVFDVLFDENEGYLLGSVDSLHVTADEIVLQCQVMDKSKDIENANFDFAKITYDMDGNKKSIVLLEENDNLALVRKYIADEEGNTYILTEPNAGIDSNAEAAFNLYLLKYDAQGKKQCVQQMKNYMDDIVLYNGKIVLKRSSEMKTDLGYYDIETDTYESSQFRDMYPFQEYCSLVGTYNQDVLILSDNYLYSFNCENNELKVLVDLKADFIDINGVRAVKQISDDEVIFIYSADGYSYEIMHFDTKSNNDNSDKTSIKIAAIGCSDGDFVQIINDYSRHNNEYMIDFVDYELDSDAYVSMMKDIASGNAPDIYIVNNMDYENLVAKDMLEDLKPYIAKDDVVNEDFFIEGYLDAVTEEGKQYILSKTITIDALAGKEDEMGQYKDGWTLDDIIDYYQTKQGAYLFSSLSAFDIFTRMFTGNMDSFIDWDNGKCSFESDEFRKLLGFCKVVGYVECGDLSGNEMYDAIKKGQLLFMSDEISGIENILLNNALYGGNAVYMGYPSDIDNGIYLRSDLSTFAISSGSDNKDAAWAIIKELMTGGYSRYDYTRSANIGVPVSKKEFEKMERFEIATKEYTDEDGNEVKPLAGSNYNGVELNKPVKADFDVLKALISKAKYCNKDNFIVEIMAEDVKDYLAGDKDLDRTVDIIQDKMSKYVNENL